MTWHFARTQSDATWTTGNYITLQSDWKDLSRKIFRAVNGVEGGVWSPRASNSVGITIGGQGLTINGPSKIDYGGRLTARDGAVFYLGGNEWPRLSISHVGRTRSIVTPVTEMSNTLKFTWLLNRKYMGMQSLSCTYEINGFNLQPTFVLQLRTHEGARMTKARLKFRVPTNFNRTPEKTPKVRILRVDEYGNSVPLCSMLGGADKDGFVYFPTPSSADDWYAGGEVKELVYPCDQNNVIDVFNFSYVAEVYEEVSSSARIDPNLTDGRKERFVVEVYRVLRNHFPTIDRTIDGVVTRVPAPISTADLKKANGFTPLDDGAFVLLTGQGPSPVEQASNGLWIISSAGWWTRLFDGVPGLVVIAKELSSTSDYKVWSTVDNAWELASPVRPNDIPKFPVNVYRPVTPQGNIYHSITCDFDSIENMRPQ